jgi:predicted ATPase
MPETMRDALARHDGVVRAAIEGHGGYVFATGGDGFAAAFGRAGDALAAAVDAQRRVGAEIWPEALPVRVRIGVHTGEANERGGDYFGPAVNRAARLMAVAHGGQVVCSSATAELVEGATLVDLGDHRLRDLDRPVHVFQVGEGRFPPLRSLDAFPGNLPLQVSSFVGRDRELERVAKAMGESRVVTLAGAGGVGKTRLALQVAAEALPSYRDGAWLVELAPVRDPADVADAVALVFELAPRSVLTTTDALIEFLRGKELLAVMDNCEHVVEATAALVEAVERWCPRVTVLATSREGLGIDGERMLAVPPLAAPAPGAGHDAVAQAAAVRLFVERAQAVKSEFALTTENAASVAQVCRQLDGVPLAIELAAARIAAMNPAELARRLERRFEVLAGGRRGAVERHQTLRAAIDWSYGLLSASQQRLLARLSVFAGGCTVEAAEAVCAGEPVDACEVWELMAALVARSLVVAEDHGPETRYRLLETIRQYGEERLDEQGETAECRRHHAQYNGALFGRVTGSWFFPESASRLADEQDNIIRAMSWAIDHADIDLALRLLCSIPPSNVQTGLGFQLAAEPVLALPGAAGHPDYSLGLAIAASFAAVRGDVRVATQQAEEAEAAERRLGTHPNGLVDEFVATSRGSVAMAAGSWHEAAAHTERAASSARRAGRMIDAAGHMSAATALYAFGGETDAAVPLGTEALALARGIGMPLLTIFCLGSLASALAERDPAKASALMEESLDLSRAVHY